MVYINLLTLLEYCMIHGLYQLVYNPIQISVLYVNNNRLLYNVVCILCILYKNCRTLGKKTQSVIIMAIYAMYCQDSHKMHL